MITPRHLVVAPDKFRGTVSASEAAKAISSAAALDHWVIHEVPISDGGEGFADVVGDLLGATTVSCHVTGPLGERVQANYRLSNEDRTAVIEMAAAAGRGLMPHPRGDDPVSATTRGVGELIMDAAGRGLERIIVGCGGSATTDGGLGALSVIDELGGLHGVELIVATDVTTRYLDAAKIFGAQKGASAEQVEILSLRLKRSASVLLERFGVDVTSEERTGAAGGLAGGLFAVGGVLLSGFDVIRSLSNLGELLDGADLVITGEGNLDASTLEGKAVMSVIALTPEPVPVLVIAGAIEADAAKRISTTRRGTVEFISLSERFGRDRSMNHTVDALHDAAIGTLTSPSSLL